MHSCIYEGRVTHCRYSPVTHKFGYRLYMAYLDLDEWRESSTLRSLISQRRFSLGSFLRTDHLATWPGPLDEAVRDLVAAQTGQSSARSHSCAHATAVPGLLFQSRELVLLL